MNNKIWWVSGGVVVLVVIFLLINNNTNSQSNSPLAVAIATATPFATSTPKATGAKLTTMKIEDVKVGTGAEAVSGKKVTVHYTGTLENGTKFDSSKDHGAPFSFNLGAGEVIQGWDQGVVGMKIGGVRKLTIPSELGYGAYGSPPVIPANATLLFEIELLGVE